MRQGGAIPHGFGSGAAVGAAPVPFAVAPFAFAATSALVALAFIIALVIGSCTSLYMLQTHDVRRLDRWWDWNKNRKRRRVSKCLDGNSVHTEQPHEQKHLQNHSRTAAAR